VATWAVGAVDGDDGPAPGSPWQSRGLPAGGARRPRRPGWRQPANELWSDGQPAVTLWPGQRDHRRHRATRPARGRVPYERTVVADLKVGPSKPAVPWPVSHRRMTRRRWWPLGASSGGASQNTFTAWDVYITRHRWW